MKNNNLGWLLIWLFGGCLLFSLNCDESDDNNDDGGVQFEIPIPSVTSISTYEASVGDEIRFWGTDFISPNDGYSEITFRGEFIDDNGNSKEVNFSAPVSYIQDGELIWNFGPYNIPFTESGDELGVFKGVIFATNYSYEQDKNGMTEQRQNESSWVNIEFRVLPSLIIREFYAYGNSDSEGYWQSSCRIIPERVINYLSYKLQIATIGFSAQNFNYTLSPGIVINDQSSEATTEQTEITHDHTGNWDYLGENETISFGEVPYGIFSYRTGISINVTDENNVQHNLLLKITVRRPLEVRYNGNVQIAEIYEPVPVSGCIPGGLNGRNVEYSEMHEESRERRLALGWETGWEQSYTESHSETYGEGGSEANRIGFSSTDQTNWNYNINGQIYAEAGLNVGVVSKGGFQIGAGYDSGGSKSYSQNGDASWSQSHTYSEANELSQTIQESESQSGTEEWIVSSSDCTALSFSGFIIPQMYGVFYRQTTRMIRQGQVVAYDLCGNSTVVGEVVLNDYTWSPDLAIGTECGATFPETSLPEAQCIISPCDNSY